MPLTMLVNYIYFHSFTVVVGLTIVSNIIGYVAHYFFEMGWSRMWRFASGGMKIKKSKSIEEAK